MQRSMHEHAVSSRAPVERAAELLLAVGAGHDPLEIKAGKRLPLAFEKGKHLPQGFGQGYGCSHYFVLNSRPAAIIASATRIGMTG